MICKNDFVKRQETDCKACKRALCMCAEVAGPGCARTGHIIKREATQGAIHFKEDVLRVKRSRFRIVIPSLRSRASSELVVSVLTHPSVALPLYWQRVQPGFHFVLLVVIYGFIELQTLLAQIERT